MSYWIETWDAGYREFWRVVKLPDGTLLPIEGPYRRSYP